MRRHGFVIIHGPDAGERPFSATPDLDAGHATGPGLSLRVRPFPTTPEADREVQPIVTPRVVLAYRGHVDNRAEVARRLGQPELLRASDGAVLAAAYEAWGRDLSARVIGEYAFALLDRRDGALVAGTDSLGIGRLLYHEDGPVVRVATDVDLLLEALPARPGLDREFLCEYFAGGGLPSAERTVFGGVRRLPPGLTLEARGGGIVWTRPWRPDPERRLSLANEAEYHEAFRDVLFEGVAASLRSNGPVWSDLSGGLDSGTVLSVAALLWRAGAVSQPLAARSMTAPATPESDESAYQQALLRSYPLQHHVVDRSALPNFTALDYEGFRSHPDVALTNSAYLKADLALYEAHGVRVSLCGIGGDQVFCGDHFPPAYLADWLRERRWKAWWRDVRGWLALGRRSFWNLLYHCSGPGEPTPGPDIEALDPPAWLTRDFAQQVGETRRRLLLGEPGQRRVSAKERYLRDILAIPSTLLLHRTPYEQRLPLLYRPLVEFTAALPWEHKLRPGEDRVIQRRALEGILPEAIRTRTTKTAVTAVMLKGLRENWRRIEPLTHGRRLSDLRLVEPAAFHAACKRYRHGFVDRELPFYQAALSLEAWLRWTEERPAADGAPTARA